MRVLPGVLALLLASPLLLRASLTAPIPRGCVCAGESPAPLTRGLALRRRLALPVGERECWRCEGDWRSLLVLRGGQSDSEDVDEDMDSEINRDKYADDPPADHIRYTGGVRPAPKPGAREDDGGGGSGGGGEHRNETADGNATVADDAPWDRGEMEREADEYDPAQAIVEEMKKAKDEDGSSDEEPLWVPGQIRQGGSKLPYVDGHADYFRDVLNTSDPMQRFTPDYSKGHTRTDMDFALRAWQSYRPSQQVL